MARIYLTAMWARREEMKHHRSLLVGGGHYCTSRWLDEAEGTPPAEAAQIDIEDIDESDIVIVFSQEPSIGFTTGGRHVELGYAIAKGKRILVVGPRENVFFNLPKIEVVGCFEDALAKL